MNGFPWCILGITDQITLPEYTKDNIEFTSVYIFCENLFSIFGAIVRMITIRTCWKNTRFWPKYLSKLLLAVKKIQVSILSYFAYVESYHLPDWSTQYIFGVVIVTVVSKLVVLLLLVSMAVLSYVDILEE